MNSKESVFAAAIMAAALACSQTAVAAIYNIKDGVSDWTKAESYEENAVPGAGDTVKIANGRTVTLDASGDSGSLALVNALALVLPDGDAAELDVFVAEGDVKVLNCPFTSYQDATARSWYWGRFVKTGSGMLDLGASTASKIYRESDNTTFAFYTHYLDVAQGTLRLPQDAASVNFRYGEISVSQGAVLQTATLADAGSAVYNTGITMFQALSGLGTVTNAGSVARFLRPMESCRFDGVLGGKMIVSVNGDGIRFLLTNENSTYDSTQGYSLLSGVNSTVGLQKFGYWKDEPSSMGKGWKWEIGENDRLLYLGHGETTAKTLIINKSPCTIDAGAEGGLSILSNPDDGASVFSGAYDSTTTPSYMQHLILDGSNRTACVFGPRILWWSDRIGETTNLTMYITKRGTGTWKFVRNPLSNWRGGVGAEEGTLQFDTLLEVGQNCSFGLAYMLQKPYFGLWTPENNVDYAIALGGTPALPTLEYVGTSFVSVVTRPIGILTRGRVVNSGTRRFRLSNVFGVGAGEKELVLDGDSEKQDTLENVSDGKDGGTLGVTKRGTGDWVLGGALTFSGRLKVEDGTLYVHDGKHYSWFKLTVLDAWNQWYFRMSEYALYDSAGKRVNVGMSAPSYPGQDVTDNSNFDASTDYTILKPNSAAIGRMEYKYQKTPLTYEIPLEKISGITLERDSMAKLFDDVPAASLDDVYGANSRTDLKATESGKLSIFAHAARSVKVASYDIAYWANHASAPIQWKMDASVNGLDWVKVNETSQKPSSSANNCWSRLENGSVVQFTAAGQTHQGYPIALAPEGTPPQVLNNATVAVGPKGKLLADGDIAISKLEVDASGAGVIDGFTFAESGTLNVVNLPKKPVVTLPGSYVNVAGLEHLANWTLTVDGQVKPSKRISVANGEVRVISDGLVITIR